MKRYRVTFTVEVEAVDEYSARVVAENAMNGKCDDLEITTEVEEMK